VFRRTDCYWRIEAMTYSPFDTLNPAWRLETAEACPSEMVLSVVGETAHWDLYVVSGCVSCASDSETKDVPTHSSCIVALDNDPRICSNE